MANPFHFSNGQDAHNEKELQAILETIDEKSVEHHVREGHFEAWIRHELKNEKLANRVKHCRTIQQVLDVLHLENTPRPTIPKPAKKAHREPIRDLEKPSKTEEKPKEQSQEVFEMDNHSKPEPIITNKKPARPEPISSSVEKYNAKEFVLGLAIGVVLGVLLYALVAALA